MEERLSVDTEVMVIWPADIWFMLLMLPLEAMGTPLMFGLALLYIRNLVRAPFISEDGW
uniref:Uncharacterized protein n=1 Tax=Oncorhynchus tshawytscha TaxID=74940 RepID=A0A8C8EME5_ONCTS